MTILRQASSLFSGQYIVARVLFCYALTKSPQAYPEVNDEDISKEVQHPIACIVSKQDMHRGKRTRGYIAMLSVERAWRRKGIGG